MRFLYRNNGHEARQSIPTRAALAVASLLLQAAAVAAAPVYVSGDPFQVLDPQNWVNPDDMTLPDYKLPPNTNWRDPSRRGSVRNFNIALVALDYPDKDFIVTQPALSTIFNNPQPSAADLGREEVASFYRDLLNTPNDLNGGRTLHEYWMEDSGGRFGVDLTSFGPYRLPNKSYQYGIDNSFNPGTCPQGERCNLNIRTDGTAQWAADVGREETSRYELVFIMSAGQDESSTWREFGVMKFGSREAVPDEWGPPEPLNGTVRGTNWANTRNGEWTSWKAASTLWPNAGGGSSTQGESSGMAVFAHELSHLLGIGDNYNADPYGPNATRAHTGPWSMMSHGSFNGPGGTHTRWQVPALVGASQGSLHTVRDKLQLGLLGNESVLHISRDALATSGLVVANLTARAVAPGPDGLAGLKVVFGPRGDLSPPCSSATQWDCDGGGYSGYYAEVVDRMGSDSFQSDAGVLLTKAKDSAGAANPFQWTIDANPQDIQTIDYVLPNGEEHFIGRGDYRQQMDALFHAGTRSGSQFEYVDVGNRLHFYILDKHRDAQGVLSYTVAVRSLDGNGGLSERGVALAEGVASPGRATGAGLTCFFELTNNGTYVDGGVAGAAQHPQDLSAFLAADVYRLNATVDGAGWRVELPNALALAQFGGGVTAKVAVGAAADASAEAVVRLTAVSESDGSVAAGAECRVTKS